MQETLDFSQKNVFKENSSSSIILNKFSLLMAEKHSRGSPLSKKEMCAIDKEIIKISLEGLNRNYFNTLQPHQRINYLNNARTLIEDYKNKCDDDDDYKGGAQKFEEEFKNKRARLAEFDRKIKPQEPLQSQASQPAIPEFLYMIPMRTFEVLKWLSQ